MALPLIAFLLDPHQTRSKVSDTAGMPLRSSILAFSSSTRFTWIVFGLAKSAVLALATDLAKLAAPPTYFFRSLSELTVED